MSYPPVRYTADAGAVSATARDAAASPDLVLRTTNVHYLATGASTGGDFGLYRWEMTGPATTPAPHFHRTFSESFYVLDGTVGLYDGNEWTDATAGAYYYVPPGGIHAFRNTSGVPATMLVLFAPGAPREAYFEGLAELATRDVPPEEMDEFFRRHDQYMV